MIKDSEVFFETYSMAVEAAYEAYMNIVSGDFPREDADADGKLKIYLDNEYKKWLGTPLEKLAGRTPADYMDSIEGLDDLMMMFIHGAVICDDILPEIYLKKLQSCGDSSIDALINLAIQGGTCDNVDALLAPLMAVKVLGTWKAVKAVEPLIKMLDSEGEIFDLMFETIKDTLVLIGDPALEPISSALESGKHPRIIDDYLLMAYTDIGKMNKSEKIYTRLKKAFFGMPEKLVAASCLGDYGDGRAVTVLRSFIEKNGPSLDRETFFEIVSAIKKLGGRTGDLL